MLPLCVQDLIYEYVLAIRIAEINREVKERYAERITNVSKEELLINVPLWVDWVDSRMVRDSFRPFQNYGAYLDWLSALY